MAEESLFYLLWESQDPPQSFPLSGNYIHIGRSPQNEVVIDHPSVSRLHARLIRQKGTYILEDLNSTNGTFVNERRVVHPVVLQPGDVIRLGPDVRLRFIGPEGDLAPTVAVAVQPQPQAATPETPTPVGATQMPPPPPPSSDYTPIAHALRPEEIVQARAVTVGGQKRGLPKWVWGVLAGLLFLLMACGGWLYWIDVTNRWCSTIFRALLPGCP